MNKKPLLLVTLSFAVLTACSSTPKPAYVSPVQYQDLSCQALQAEYNRIHQYIETGVSPEKRTGVGVGLGVGGGWGSRGGWGIGPSISINMGQSGATKKSELERVLGEQEAIVQAAKYKRCPILLRSNKATTK